MPLRKEILEKLVASIEELKLSVAALDGKFSVVPKEIPKEEPKIEVIPMPDYPIPADFKEAVRLTLNSRFKVRLDPMKDSPAFLFTIVVPPKYTKVVGEDLRPKVITFADGVAGVRIWAEKVFSNFDSEIQKQIIDDRAFPEDSVVN